MQPSRFRLRTLMVAMAIVAALLFLGVMTRRRSEEFRRHAFIHAAMSNGAMMDAAGFRNEKGREAESSEAAKRVVYHRDLMRKYERLVSHPWAPRPDDPLVSQVTDWDIPPTPIPQY